MKARRNTRSFACSAMRKLRAVLVVGVSLAVWATGASAASAAGSGPYFTPSSGMVFDREDAVAAPLPNGDVLVAGGVGQKTAVVFNPATGSLSPTNNEMQDVRAGAAAASLPNGEVLIAGGTGEGQSAELYDSATEAFTLLTAKLTIARINAVATRLPDGNVLITGGSTEQQAELYEPGTKTFKATTHPMLTARTGAAAAKPEWRSADRRRRLAGQRGSLQPDHRSVLRRQRQRAHRQRKRDRRAVAQRPGADLGRRQHRGRAEKR